MTDTLRVHIITEEDPFYLPVFFAEFFSALPNDGIEVTGIDITPPLNQGSRWRLARKLWNFYGPRDFARLIARYALARGKDLVLPHRWWAGTIARLARRHGVPCRDVAAVNAPDFVEALRALKPDLLISVAASQIFREPLLAVPRLEPINIHTGALPEYRGMLPVFWQMHNGERAITITIHTLTTAIDLGEILSRTEVPLTTGTSLDAAIRTMKRAGARALHDLLARYRAGTVTRAPMEAGGGRYRTFPTRADAVAFRRAGGRLL